LKRVIYLSGFSKTLAASLRVGYIAAAAPVARQLADLKMLTGLATPELTERVVARVLAEGQYRRHLDRLRGKLDAARDRTARALERMGARLALQPEAGIFLWADFGRDTTAIAAEGSAQGVLCAPGALFSPTQLPSSFMRVSVAASMNAGAMKFLESALRCTRSS
jgi:DNA-binding transcriptional MocR family regulator